MTTALAAALSFAPPRRPLFAPHVRAVLVGVLAGLVLHGGGGGAA